MDHPNRGPRLALLLTVIVIVIGVIPWPSDSAPDREAEWRRLLLTPTTIPALQDAPQPAECTVTPRSADDLLAVARAPRSGAIPGITLELFWGVNLSIDGERWLIHDQAFLPSRDAASAVDPATARVIADTLRRFTACLNAGDPRRYLAFFSDLGLSTSVSRSVLLGQELLPGILTHGRFPALSDPATPLGAQYRLASGQVLGSRLLPDGRVVVYAARDQSASYTRDERMNDYFYRPRRVVVLSPAGDRWLIDLVVEGTEIVPPVDGVDRPSPVECQVTPRSTDEMLAIVRAAAVATETDRLIVVPDGPVQITGLGEQNDQPRSKENGWGLVPIDMIVDGVPWVLAGNVLEHPSPPVGQPVDAETVREITATLREMTACGNAEDYQRAFSFLTDHRLARWVWGSMRPDPRSGASNLAPSIRSGDRPGVLFGRLGAEGLLTGNSGDRPYEGWQEAGEIRAVRLLPDGRVAALVREGPWIADSWNYDHGSDIYLFVKEGNLWLLDEIVGPLVGSTAVEEQMLVERWKAEGTLTPNPSPVATGEGKTD